MMTMMMMLMPKNRMMRAVLLGAALLSGCATTTSTSTTTASTADGLVVREGYHKRLQSLSVNEAARISAFFGSTLFVVPETVSAGPLTCAGIVQGVNEQLTKEGKGLRVVFEFSRENEGRFRSLIAQPLSSWHGTPLEPAEVRARLEAAGLSEVLESVGEQLGLNVLWYGGTVVLAEHFIGG